MDKQIIEGVIAEKDGNGWGVAYSDGKCTSKDFVRLNNAEISDPKHCHKPTDKTYEGSPEAERLKGAKLVKVRRTIITEIIE